MTSIIKLDLTAPPLPGSWSQETSASGKTIVPLVPRTLIPVGPAYLAHVRRSVHNHSFEEHDKAEAERHARRQAHADANGIEDDLGVGDEKETSDLLALDPKEWKKQDHYAVLGLSHLRYRATQDQIKIAHRKKVLKHHPDKKAGAAGQTNDDAFFKCIQKALEVLSNAERRRQFDSVDPYYRDLEDSDPSEKEIKKAVEKNENAFFKIFRPIFEREARFSKTDPVPQLGDMEEGKESVEEFYNFWYNFDSWRSFEYLDKEVNEGSDNRDDKRYTEKKNKTERARRKKEDIARVRTLVDVALAHDPRIKLIKQREKEARAAKKKGGKGADDAKKKQEEEAAAKKKQEEEKEAQEKAEREAAKERKKQEANEKKKARRAARKAEEDGAAS